MEQMKYRIKVEPIEGAEFAEDEMPDQELLDGIECNGFGLLLSKGRKNAQILLHDTNMLELALCMKGEPMVQAAARIAEILDEAQRKEIPDFLKSLAKKLEKE